MKPPCNGSESCKVVVSLLRMLVCAARNNAEIAADLVSFLQAWIYGHPEFEVAPVFIASESYGGKMAITFARAIQEAQKSGDIKVNLK